MIPATPPQDLPDLDIVRDDDELIPCPACPDGYVWNSNGPTGATCPRCKGHAVVYRNGTQLSKESK